MRYNGIALVAAIALSLLGCGPAAYRYRVGVLTPDTPEGNACRRECLALVGVCAYYREGSVQVHIEAGAYSSRYGCPGIVSDCLLTCEGAIVARDDPPRMVPVGWGYSDDAEEREDDEFVD